MFRAQNPRIVKVELLSDVRRTSRLPSGTPTGAQVTRWRRVGAILPALILWIGAMPQSLGAAGIGAQIRKGPEDG